MNTFLMNSLYEISERIECKGIIYDGENVWLREKKLREVTDEYTKKYSKEFPSSNVNNSFYHPNSSQNLSLNAVRQANHNLYLRIDERIHGNEDERLMILAVAALLTWHSTRLIEHCY